MTDYDDRLRSALEEQHRQVFDAERKTLKP